MQTSSFFLQLLAKIPNEKSHSVIHFHSSISKEENCIILYKKMINFCTSGKWELVVSSHKSYWQLYVPEQGNCMQRVIVALLFPILWNIKPLILHILLKEGMDRFHILVWGSVLLSQRIGNSRATMTLCIQFPCSVTYNCQYNLWGVV